MLKKVYAENGMVTDGWISLDPADIGLIEAVYKKTLREGEEKLMLAVLDSAVEDFQRYVLARHTGGKKLFQQAEEWILEKESGRFSRLRVSVKPYSYILTTYGRACCSGRKRSSKRLLLKIIVQVTPS